MLAVRGRP